MSRDIKVTFPGGKQVDAEDRGMIIHTDQSARNGGEESAPEPFSLFLASIATCAGIYALEFCLTRKLTTEGLSVVMCADRDAERKMYTRIRLEVTPPKDFPEKYRDALVRAVNLCSVKKHLMNPPEFETEMMD